MAPHIGRHGPVDDCPLPCNGSLFLFFSDHLAVRARKGPKKEHVSPYFARILDAYQSPALTQDQSPTSSAEQPVSSWPMTGTKSIETNTRRHHSFSAGPPLSGQQ